MLVDGRVVEDQCNRLLGSKPSDMEKAVQPILESVLKKAVVGCVTENGPQTAWDVNGPGTVYAHLVALRTSRTLTMLHLGLANSLPYRQARAFLAACCLFPTGDVQDASGIVRRLAVVSDKLAKLTSAEFTPEKILKLAYPELAMTDAIRNLRATDTVSVRALEEYLKPFYALTKQYGARVSCCLKWMFKAGMSISDLRAFLKDPTSIKAKHIPLQALVPFPVKAANTQNISPFLRFAALYRSKNEYYIQPIKLYSEETDRMVQINDDGVRRMAPTLILDEGSDVTCSYSPKIGGKTAARDFKAALRELCGGRDDRVQQVLLTMVEAARLSDMLVSNMDSSTPEFRLKRDPTTGDVLIGMTTEAWEPSERGLSLTIRVGTDGALSVDERKDLQPGKFLHPCDAHGLPLDSNLGIRKDVVSTKAEIAQAQQTISLWRQLCTAVDKELAKRLPRKPGMGPALQFAAKYGQWLENFQRYLNGSAVDAETIRRQFADWPADWIGKFPARQLNVLSQVLEHLQNNPPETGRLRAQMVGIIVALKSAADSALSPPDGKGVPTHTLPKETQTKAAGSPLKKGGMFTFQQANKVKPANRGVNEVDIIFEDSNEQIVSPGPSKQPSGKNLTSVVQPQSNPGASGERQRQFAQSSRNLPVQQEEGTDVEADQIDQVPYQRNPLRTQTDVVKDDTVLKLKRELGFGDIKTESDFMERELKLGDGAEDLGDGAEDLGDGEGNSDSKGYLLDNVEVGSADGGRISYIPERGLKFDTAPGEEEFELVRKEDSDTEPVADNPVNRTKPKEDNSDTSLKNAPKFDEIIGVDRGSIDDSNIGNVDANKKAPQNEEIIDVIRNDEAEDIRTNVNQGGDVKANQTGDAKANQTGNAKANQAGKARVRHGNDAKRTWDDVRQELRRIANLTYDVREGANENIGLQFGKVFRYDAGTSSSDPQSPEAMQCASDDCRRSLYRYAWSVISRYADEENRRVPDTVSVDEQINWMMAIRDLLGLGEGGSVTAKGLLGCKTVRKFFDKIFALTGFDYRPRQNVPGNPVDGKSATSFADAVKVYAEADAEKCLKGRDARAEILSQLARLTELIELDQNHLGIDLETARAKMEVLLRSSLKGMIVDMGRRPLLKELAAPGSVFGSLMELAAAGRLRDVHIDYARQLPYREAKAFLRACCILPYAANFYVAARLAAVANELSRLPSAGFTVENVLRLAFPGFPLTEGVKDVNTNGHPSADAVRVFLNQTVDGHPHSVRDPFLVARKSFVPYAVVPPREGEAFYGVLRKHLRPFLDVDSEEEAPRLVRLDSDDEIEDPFSLRGPSFRQQEFYMATAEELQTAQHPKFEMLDDEGLISFDEAELDLELEEDDEYDGLRFGGDEQKLGQGLERRYTDTTRLGTRKDSTSTDKELTSGFKEPMGMSERSDLLFMREGNSLFAPPEIDNSII